MSSPASESLSSPPHKETSSTETSPRTKRAARRGDRFILETRSLVQHLQTIEFTPHVQPLRPSHSFDLVVPKRVRDCQRGGANVHIPILWDDGKRWLMRIKLHWTVAFGEVPREIRRLVLESEKETMTILKGAGMAVPEVYGPVFETDGIELIVVECMDGTPCSRPIHQALSGPPLDRLIRQFAESQIKLSKLTFPLLGSLYPSHHDYPEERSEGTSITSGPRVGPSISLRFFHPTSPYFLGPFHTAGERYLANIDLMLNKLEHGDRTLGHPAVAYLVHLWYQHFVTSTLSLWVSEEKMIRHADDQGDHILSDPEGNLSGIIDWEWAVTSTKSDAFTAPMGLVDFANFQSGSNDLSIPELKLAKAYTELGREDLADCVRGGKVHQRLWSCIGSRPGIGKVRGLANLARFTEENDAGHQLQIGMDMDLAEWCVVTCGEYKDNEVLAGLMSNDGLSWAERCAIREDVEGVMSSP